MNNIYSVFVVECFWTNGSQEESPYYTLHQVFANHNEAEAEALRLLAEQRQFESDSQSVYVRVTEKTLR